ncbi:MAG: cytochrome b [Candidatus Azotimanducaceae bacterium]
MNTSKSDPAGFEKTAELGKTVEPKKSEGLDKSTSRIWDIPIRLYHWVLLALVATSIYTGESGGFNEMDYHMLAGYSILALLLFRITWGFVGTYHARFVNFIRLGAIPAYLKGEPHPGKRKPGGHNPLGALSVVALLLSILVQASTGLFANDDIFFEGPLAHLVSDEMSNQLTSIHHLNIKILYGLIALHLSAIAFHELKRGERLILAMLHGRRSDTAGPDVPLKWVHELVIASLILALTAGAVFGLINFV